MRRPALDHCRLDARDGLGRRAGALQEAAVAPDGFRGAVAGHGREAWRDELDDLIAIESCVSAIAERRDDAQEMQKHLASLEKRLAAVSALLAS